MEVNLKSPGPGALSGGVDFSRGLPGRPEKIIGLIDKAE